MASHYGGGGGGYILLILSFQGAVSGLSKWWEDEDGMVDDAADKKK